MVTVTDTEWTDRLASIMPANFLSNVKDTFTANTGYLDTMMNMIGRTVIHGVDNVMNPFDKYTKGIMDYGDTIQEYKTKFLEGQEYDPNATTPFAINTNKPIAQYSTYNDKVQYAETVHDDQLELAFTGPQTFGDFVASKIASMAQSDALDKWIKWKKRLSVEGIAKVRKVEADLTNSQYASALLADFKDLVYDFKMPSDDFNVNGDMAISEGVDIIMRRKDKNLIDKELSGVYNLEKLEIDANYIFIDDFATVTPLSTGSELETGDELVAMVVDSRALSYVPRTVKGGSIYNPKGLYYNYFLTVQGIYTTALFRNAVQIYRPANTA